jgi:hypothetical protein
LYEFLHIYKQFRKFTFLRISPSRQSEEFGGVKQTATLFRQARAAERFKRLQHRVIPIFRAEAEHLCGCQASASEPSNRAVSKLVYRNKAMFGLECTFFIILAGA